MEFTQETFDMMGIFLLGLTGSFIVYFFFRLIDFLFAILKYAIERSREKHKQKKEEQNNHKE